MKIELKSLKIFLPGSHETINFVADLYVDNVKTAHVHNEGCGGPTNYMAYNGADEILAGAEQYCLSLPAEICNDFSEPFEIKMNLENFIDKIVGEEVRKKEMAKLEKQIAKDQIKGLLFTTNPEGQPVTEYNIISWKGRLLQDVVNNVQFHAILKETIVKYTAQGKRLINTNLPGEFIALNKKQTA